MFCLVFAVLVGVHGDLVGVPGVSVGVLGVLVDVPGVLLAYLMSLALGWCICYVWYLGCCRWQFHQKKDCVFFLETLN